MINGFTMALLTHGFGLVPGQKIHTMKSIAQDDANMAEPYHCETLKSAHRLHDGFIKRGKSRFECRWRIQLDSLQTQMDEWFSRATVFVWSVDVKGCADKVPAI